ncbi:hypothetical protein [Dactylosporangium sp. NPDC005555]
MKIMANVAPVVRLSSRIVLATVLIAALSAGLVMMVASAMR